jgi:DNA-binding response OmpR family regulator
VNSEQRKQPTIFLIEEDDQTRKPLVENLRSEGYRVIVAIDEEDALERVKDGHVHADMVLVNLIRRPVDELLRVGRRVREHAKYDSNTPLVMMPEKYSKDVEGTDVNIEGNDWIHYLGEDLNQLQTLLARLTSGI